MHNLIYLASVHMDAQRPWRFGWKDTNKEEPDLVDLVCLRQIFSALHESKLCYSFSVGCCEHEQNDGKIASCKAQEEDYTAW